MSRRESQWAGSALQGEMIRLRKKLGLSIRRAAERAGLTPMSLAAYERGERTPPSWVLPLVFAVYGHDLVPVPHGTPAELQEVATGAVEALRSAAEALQSVADTLDRPSQAVAA